MPDYCDYFTIMVTTPQRSRFDNAMMSSAEKRPKSSIDYYYHRGRRDQVQVHIKLQL